jgi:hypothetical protein
MPNWMITDDTLHVSHGDVQTELFVVRTPGSGAKIELKWRSGKFDENEETASYHISERECEVLAHHLRQDWPKE